MHHKMMNCHFNNSQGKTVSNTLTKKGYISNMMNNQPNMDQGVPAQT